MASTCGALLLGLTALLAAGCDKVPLTAPTQSTVTISAATKVLPLGGTAAVSAYVAEQAGTPVQNGTVVRFTTNLGRVDPVEVQTRNGMATTTFLAGDVSGVADVKATSGSIGNATGTATATNAVQITIGAAAVESVTLRANPGSVPATGGTVDLVATVLSAGGAPLSGIPVSFTTSEGTLSASRVVTDASGEARTSLSATLSTGGTAVVTASAGTKTSNIVTITRRVPPPTPTVTLAATPSAASVSGQLVNFAATVAGTNDTTLPTQFEWSFGDGQTATTNGPSIGHVYVASGVYTVTVTVRLTNGEPITASTQIIVVLPVI